MAKPEPGDRDLRRLRISLVLDDCLARGLVPSEVEYDGVRVCFGGYRPKEPEETASPPGVLASSAAAALEAALSAKSHRSQAREDLRRRLREAAEPAV